MARPADGPSMRTPRSGGRWTVVFVLVALVDAAAGILLPATLAGAVDAALGHTPAATPLTLLCLLVVVVTATEVAIELLEVRTVTQASAGLRHRLLGHLVRLDLRGQQRLLSGDVLTRMLESTAESARLVPTLVASSVSGLTALGGIVALLLIDPWVVLTFLAGAPLLWLLARGFLHRATTLTEDYQRAHAELATRFVDAMRGIRTIRAAGTVDREIERVLAPLPRLRASGEELWLAQRDMGYKLLSILPLLQIGVLATAGYGVVAGRVSPGGLVAVTGYLGYALGIFRQVSVLAQLGRVRGSANRVGELLQLPPAAAGSATFPPGDGAVRLRGVRVHGAERPILDQVDADIPARSAVAVVGASGVGKSTLAAVVGGLLHPDAGTVTIDGVGVAGADPTELRRVVAYAFERPALLGETVAEAIGYGDRDIDAAALAAAARDSRAEQFIRRLPRQLDTPIRELRASGGELQRLGLARAFCRGARVLVLDDAMSSVDTATELQISQALQARDRTRVIVAHRISTAARADLVLWLREGRPAVLAPHRALLAEPAYRRLFGHEPAAAVGLEPAGAGS